MKKIEYYDKINWGAILWDLGVLALVGFTMNYYLLFLLFLGDTWKLPKYELKEDY